MKRFQECNFLEKLWRYRWYLLLPFLFIKHKFNSLKVYEDKQNDDGEWYHSDDYFIADNELLWSICLGKVQHKMKWYHSMEEVENMFRLKD